MKLIIAHLPNDSFSPVRADLIHLDMLRVTVSEVHTASPQSALTLRYRGALLHSELRSELRLECVATDEQSPVIINVLRGHAGLTGQVAVLDLEEVHQAALEEPVFADDPRMDPAVH